MKARELESIAKAVCIQDFHRFANNTDEFISYFVNQELDGLPPDVDLAIIANDHPDYIARSLVQQATKKGHVGYRCQADKLIFEPNIRVKLMTTKQAQTRLRGISWYTIYIQD